MQNKRNPLFESPQQIEHTLAPMLIWTFSSTTIVGDCLVLYFLYKSYRIVRSKPRHAEKTRITCWEPAQIAKYTRTPFVLNVFSSTTICGTVSFSDSYINQIAVVVRYQGMPKQTKSIVLKPTKRKYTCTIFVFNMFSSKTVFWLTRPMFPLYKSSR